jgi:DNA (cytosine-5)-methyltransferase 1
MANTNNKRCKKLNISKQPKKQKQPGRSDDENVADTNSTRQQQGDKKMERKPPEQPNGSSIQSKKIASHTNGSRRWKGCGDSQWAVEPSVGRVADGFPGRVDRLKQLGNAVVPQIVEVIGNAILEAEKLE